ncbi:hypothetical protein bcgnr5411_41990 [Bacillus cereus]|nr:hypothetical protein IGE_05466 [Bacillus cereus HuB1-1]
MVQVEETKHLYKLTKGKITPIAEGKHYLLEESFDEDTELKKYETFYKPLEGKLYEGQYYSTIKTGKELIEQYFNPQGLERNGTN